MLEPRYEKFPRYLERLLTINQRIPFKRGIISLRYATLVNSNLCLIGLRQVGKTTLME